MIQSANNQSTNVPFNAPMMEMPIEEIVMQLQLIRSLSPMQYYMHLKKYGIAQEALRYLKAKESMSREPVNIVNIDVIKAEIEHVYKFGANFLFSNLHSSLHKDSMQKSQDATKQSQGATKQSQGATKQSQGATKQSLYPANLFSLTCPPPVLTYKGNIELLSRSSVSIVGSRQASLAGLKMAQILSKDLGIAGQVIVSGLALGIDAAAHRSSVKGGTIGVLGCGINVFYPSENAALQEQLGIEGLLLTEFPFNASVKRESFPSRNRIIAGLSWGTIVVEAGLKSGSMITAKHVIAQNRDLFAVPGHPLDSRSAGCNALIKEGAILITNANDVMQHWHAVRPNKDYVTDHKDNVKAELAQESLYQEIDESINASINDSLHDELNDSEDVLISAQNAILALLSTAPTYIDELVRHTQLPSKLVRSVLVELELENKVHIDQAFKVFKI